MIKGAKRCCVINIFVTMAISLGAAYAQEFYKDKTITFIVGYSPGGIYDQYTRLIARHISKYIPGQPNTIVENMTGAGGIIAANHLYNRAKPDGLTVAAWAAPLLTPSMGRPQQRLSRVCMRSVPHS